MLAEIVSTATSNLHVSTVLVPQKASSMRSFVFSAAVFSAALFSALVIPSAAHADTTFTYTPTNGTPVITFSLGIPTSFQTGSYEAAYYTPNATNGDYLNVTIYAAAFSQFYAESQNPDLVAEGYTPFGAFDFYLYDYNTGNEYFADGPQLYSGSSANPTFFSGSYELSGDPVYGENGQLGSQATTGGTLVINGVNATPEPSSIVLLGTGLLSVASAARRKLSKA